MPTMTIAALAKQTKLSEIDLEAIRLLNFAYSSFDPATGENHEYDSTEKRKINRFLEHAIGDMQLNKKLLVLGKYGREESGIDKMLVTDLKNLTYKTRRWSSTSLPEVQEQVNKDKKLTLNAIGTTYDLADLGNPKLNMRISEEAKKYKTSKTNEDKDQVVSFLGMWAEKIGQDSRYLTRLQKDIDIAQRVIEKLNSRFSQDFKMPPGALIFEDKEAKKTLRGEEMGILDRNLNDFTGSHVAVGIEVPGRGPILSHTNADYRQDPFSLKNSLYNDIYRIKLENLIPAEVQTYLKTNWGPGWLQDMETKFGEIQRELHDAEKTSDIGKRMALQSADMNDLSGAMRYGQIVHRLVGILHTNFFTPDHSVEEVRDITFARKSFQAEDKSPRRVICSQFAGETVIAAVKELNDRFKVELEGKGAQNIPEILLESPLNIYEQLEHLSPRRLLDALNARGALELIPSSVVQPSTAAVSKQQAMKAELLAGRRTETMKESITPEVNTIASPGA